MKDNSKYEGCSEIIETVSFFLINMQCICFFIGKAMNDF